MRDFGQIAALAAQRKGGMPALKKLLAATPSRSPEAIAAMPDDRILAEMARRIFSAGFSTKVIQDKWPAFETAFHGFDPRFCAALDREGFEALMQDRGIVRNAAKVKAVQANAGFVEALAQEHGKAARFFADWPDDDYAGLLDVLKTRGSRLSGDAGMRFLRSIGKPAYILTRDVVAALIREGIVTRAPSGQRDLRIVQNAFNQWSKQSGCDLTAISRTLAMSVEA